MASEQTALPISAPGTLTAFRFSTYDVPFWARPNTRAGRWNRVGDDPTQYWSLSPAGAWAELIRAEGLTRERELDLVQMPLWVCTVPATLMHDLHDPGVQASYGLDFTDLIDDDHTACQAAARALRADCPGVIAPCPALDGHANLTLFGARRAIEWLSQPALASTIPAAVAAIGRPPRDLLARVRRPSTPSPQAQLF
ncbi:MAG: RES family NAD+ phosphorylase [Solirubrobacteraceae bacterium MAG38_C4-C5]|nr:RES family NAD+ phosphorylase [Candidatus Siliceabacter maunaloa]